MFGGQGTNNSLILLQEKKLSVKKLSGKLALIDGHFLRCERSATICRLLFPSIVLTKSIHKVFRSPLTMRASNRSISFGAGIAEE